MRPVATSPFGVALAFRLVNAFASRAFFQPDEYWQSLEVAHAWVFGYGYKTWEWRSTVTSASSEWTALLNDGGRGGIRSPSSVVPTACVFKLLRMLDLDSKGEWLVVTPRILQAVFAASADVAVTSLAETVLGPEYGNAALVVSLTSFFNFFTSTRTFSNSTETVLTAWALAHWPWESYSPRRTPTKDARDENKDSLEGARLASLGISLAFAAVATVIRPSNAIIWLILGTRLLLASSSRRRAHLIVLASLVSLVAIGSSVEIDTWFYGTLTFTPLRFLATNVFNSISLFYGQSPWHFYLFQAIPLLLLTQLAFFVDGVRKSWHSVIEPPPRHPRAIKELGVTVAGTVAGYSVLSHKEWRFLHPILPILHLFVAASLVSSHRSHTAPFRTSTRTTRLLAIAQHPFERLARRCRINLAHFAILVVSLVPAAYLASFHQRGQTDVVLWLRDELRWQRRGNRTSRIESVGFAMPCHSTPWQSHLHAEDFDRRGKLWFITCEPPISGQPQDVYLDQSDHFYESPSTYFLSRFPRSVDPTFPPSLVSSSPDPFIPVPSTPSKPARSTSTIDKARRRLVEDRFDLGWTYSAWPSHLVVFEHLLDRPCRPGERCVDVRDLLCRVMGYRVEKKFWNGIRGWHEDERRSGGVVVLAWYDSLEEKGVAG
ncbi:hypothetical protein JCM3766R1_001831 [Sporobolomyces carnicolor]